MRFQRIAIAAAVAAGLAALPFSPAKAQYYPLPVQRRSRCSGRSAPHAGGRRRPSAAIVTAPFRGAVYPYYPRYYYGTPAVPYYYPPTGAYYPPAGPIHRSPHSTGLCRREPSSRHRRPRPRSPTLSRSSEIAARSRWRRCRRVATIVRSGAQQFRKEARDADPQSLHRRQGPVAFPRHRGRVGRGEPRRQTVEAAAGDRHHLPRGAAGLTTSTGTRRRAGNTSSTSTPGCRSPRATARRG